MGIEFGLRERYWSGMSRLCVWILVVACLAGVGRAGAATGRVIKVLPSYLDLRGRQSLSPSLYERDAFQAQLRDRPDRRSGIRYDVRWQAKGPVKEPLKLRLELRGFSAEGKAKRLTLENTVELPHWWGKWTGLTLSGQQYKEFGEPTCWRVTLWEGEQLLGEQKSFLW
jgi:hypothetical protein